MIITMIFMVFMVLSSVYLTKNNGIERNKSMMKTLLKIVMIVALFTFIFTQCDLLHPVPKQTTKQTTEIDTLPEKVDRLAELPPRYKIQKGDGVERYRVEVWDTYTTVHSFKTKAEAHRVAWDLHRHETEEIKKAILNRETTWKDLD